MSEFKKPRASAARLGLFRPSRAAFVLGPRAGRRGFTLVEMLMVLMILVALAAAVVPLVADLRVNGQSPEAIGTETTMLQVRDTIMGSAERPGVWADVGQRPQFFPRALPDLFLEVPPYAGLPPFDPITGVGWRGPYLTRATGETPTPFGGGSSAPTLVDCWRNPLEIQVDFNLDGQVSEEEARYARLVSPGPNGILETPLGLDNMIPGEDPSQHLTLAECGDDLVLFFRVPDTRR